MKRSVINNSLKCARIFFESNGWILPPDPRWDVTDFGLGNFEQSGLLLINLTEEPEYCEKLMYARKDQVTPAHYHKNKKEDIICRKGLLTIQLWAKGPKPSLLGNVLLKVNGVIKSFKSGEKFTLNSGERITITQEVWHAFWPNSMECIIGEVSTVNDDLHDNFFDNPDIGRYPHIDEDEPIVVKLISD